jgi:hypothetical protein
MSGLTAESLRGILKPGRGRPFSLGCGVIDVTAQFMNFLPWGKAVAFRAKDAKHAKTDMRGA